MAGHGIVTPLPMLQGRRRRRKEAKLFTAPFCPPSPPLLVSTPTTPAEEGTPHIRDGFHQMVRFSICRKRVCSFPYEKTFWDYLFKMPNPIPADRLRRHRRRRRKRNSVWLPSSVGGRVFMVSFLLLLLSLSLSLSVVTANHLASSSSSSSCVSMSAYRKGGGGRRWKYKCRRTHRPSPLFSLSRCLLHLSKLYNTGESGIARASAGMLQIASPPPSFLFLRPARGGIREM